MNQATRVSNKDTRYHCGWTPFDNYEFSSSIQSTWVNGQQVFDGQQVTTAPALSKRLTFNR